ncbi:hypothetical protein SAMN05444392_1167 [Seinonella peptonophila]|uniref:Uncharacterized protein n=1 Tax=Seinonella peptonophila TaxID=112248 RepID=A0A1M5AUB7_9BACL|nr:hypothetical protein [Seinonella peptonophila]SHF33820.1 hypothetical protein SAMN05444392_1167 [Seinonella peptonophila]
MSQRKKYEVAFLEGYKPAVITTKKNPFIPELIKYPHNSSFDSDSNLYIFFQEEQQKTEFEKQIENIQEESYDYHYIIGLTLGFPKRSVQFYANMRQLEEILGKYPEEEERNGIGVIWSGFFFSSHFVFFKEDVRWLWDTYTHPKAINHPLFLWTEETSYLEVPYGDFHRLNEMHEYILQKRGLVPAI